MRLSWMKYFIDSITSLLAHPFLWKRTAWSARKRSRPIFTSDINEYHKQSRSSSSIGDGKLWIGIWYAALVFGFVSMSLNFSSIFRYIVEDLFKYTDKLSDLLSSSLSTLFLFRSISSTLKWTKTKQMVNHKDESCRTALFTIHTFVLLSLEYWSTFLYL